MSATTSQLRPERAEDATVSAVSRPGARVWFDRPCTETAELRSERREADNLAELAA